MIQFDKYFSNGLKPPTSLPNQYKSEDEEARKSNQKKVAEMLGVTSF